MRFQRQMVLRWMSTSAFIYAKKYVMILTMQSFLDSGPKVVEEMEKNVVVVNRVHPNEHYIGDQLDQLFEEKVPGVRLVTRHVPEEAREQRGLAPDSNTIFRQGNPDGDPDEQFIWEVTEAAQHARIVLDIHGTRSGRYAFYGELARHNRLVTGIASLACPDKAIIWTAPHLGAALPNYVGWDLTTNTNMEALRPTLEKLGAGWCPPTTKIRTECIFNRAVSSADGIRYGLKEEHEQFEPLPASTVAKLGLPLGSCAIDWSAPLYGHKGYWGDVIIPLTEGVTEAPLSTA